jgi:hypothetical protein
MTASAFRLTFLAITALIFITPLHAQTQVPTDAQLKSWIATRQQRVDLLRDEIKQMDARIESRLDVIIETLTSISDSKDSRTKVARMKEDTMKRLLKTIEYYDQKRATFRQELRNPQSRLTADDKRKAVACLRRADRQAHATNPRAEQIDAGAPGLRTLHGYRRRLVWHGLRAQ